MERNSGIPTHFVFVYGTLKRNYTNHDRYLGVAERHGKALFRFTAKTKENFTLVVRPAHMKPTTRAPVLLDTLGKGQQVCGEVFQVDDDVLQALDILEGVRDGIYYKKEVEVERTGDEAVASAKLTCTAYFYPTSEELLTLTPHASYSAELHELYRPGPLKSDIAELCQPADLHGLSTSQPSVMLVHCLRLLPGQDIVRSLLEFAEARRLDAAAVLTCVGSTGRTTLRPAGVPKPRVFDGKYEIVSLTGTLSRSGEHHLHMSISDPECNVFGGHMMEGCLVRTTAEIVLGVIQGLEFTRPMDARTGYDELSITRARHQEGIVFRGGGSAAVPAVTVPATTTPVVEDDTAGKRRRLDGGAGTAA